MRRHERWCSGGRVGLPIGRSESQNKKEGLDGVN